MCESLPDPSLLINTIVLQESKDSSAIENIVTIQDELYKAALYLSQQKLLKQPVLYLSSYVVKYKTEYYQLLKGVTENGNWNDWVMFMLTAVTETAQLTTKTIRAMLILREEMEAAMKEILGTSFNYDLLKLLFTMPYLKIELLERTQLVHRQTAASWLKKLAAGNILSPQKMGRSTISAYMPEYQ